MRRIPCVCAAVALLAAPGAAAPEQLTASGGDTSVERLGPRRSGRVALRSSGDLTPGAPGNADGSVEVYALDLATGAIRQVTASDGDSSSVTVSRRGGVVVASREDLTPGSPGNDDGNFESWLWAPPSKAAPSGLAQLTSSGGDSFFQSFWADGDRALFVSKGDLAPGAPGNADGSNEVFVVDLLSGATRQLTSGARPTVIRAICGSARCGVLESRADLTPGAPGNADGSTELFLLDLDTDAIEQVTSSDADVRYRGRDARGRLLAFTSRGDLAPGNPGNADGSEEVFVYDRSSRKLRQVTASAADSAFEAFVPRSRIVVVGSRADLVPPGNADGSRELFTYDLDADELVQHTATAGDSTLFGFASRTGALAVVESTGDLDRSGASGASHVFVQRVGRVGRPAVRLTAGPLAASAAGLDRRGRRLAVESRADLVAGGNPDGSVEVFTFRTRHAPRLRQMTSSPESSSFAGFTGRGGEMLVTSRGTLDPSGPGNADGSLEVFRVRPPTAD